jgi:acetylornithine deacetylase/succinyl-diaminopimelate desuccinylase-like protein
VSVAEKGVAWRRLRVHGVPGHGSMPYGADNALLTAAAVMARIAAYQPGAHVHELWAEHMKAMGLPDATRAALSDPERIDEALAELHPAQAAHVHAATHTTFSCNALHGPMKVNVIPGVIDLDVDIRTVPGDDAEAVQAHLDQALGDLAKQVEVTSLMNDQASSSPTGTPLWHALERSVARQFPGGRLGPQLMTGFTDARVLRELGTTVYGAGLYSDAVSLGELGRRFHGHDERVDIESLARTTELWYDLVRDLLG